MKLIKCWGGGGGALGGVRTPCGGWGVWGVRVCGGGGGGGGDLAMV